MSKNQRENEKGRIAALFDPCVLWAGRIRKYGGLGGGGGYGMVMVAGVERYAHRISWERERGPIPPYLCIDHLCRNRACVNVDHMELVSRWENVRRGTSPFAMYANSDHCVNGHPWTPENTYIRKDTGTRQCKPCHRARDRAYASRGR